jgi:hypothetical protein
VSFLHRTNKGRVVYNRRPTPFTPRDIARITNQIVEELSEQELEIFARTLVTIMVDASRLRHGAASSLQLVQSMLRSILSYILGSLTQDVIDIVRSIDVDLASALEAIRSFIKTQLIPIMIKEVSRG